MIVKDYGGPDLDVAIPTSNTWTQITIPNIRCEGASARGTPFDPCVFPDFDFQSQTLKAPPLESRLLFFGRLAEDRWHRQLSLFEVILRARLDG